MLIFKKLFKLYVFKNKQQIDLSIRVTEEYVQTYTLSISKFTELLSTWNTTGFSKQVDDGHYWVVEHKHNAPRPSTEQVSYVRLSISKNGVVHHFRVDADDIIDLEKDFYYQLNNKMHWD